MMSCSNLSFDVTNKNTGNLSKNFLLGYKITNFIQELQKLFNQKKIKPSRITGSIQKIKLFLHKNDYMLPMVSEKPMFQLQSMFRLLKFYCTKKLQLRRDKQCSTADVQNFLDIYICM